MKKKDVLVLGEKPGQTSLSGKIVALGRVLKRFKLLLLPFVLFLGLEGPVEAQLPPAQVRLLTTTAGNRLDWIDGGNNGTTTLVRYEIGRSTTRGAGYGVVGNTTNLFYVDNTGVAGTTYYYVIREVYAGPAGTTGWSEEIIRFWPFQGATTDAQIYKSESVVRARWALYENEIVKSFVGLGTTPGGDDVVPFVDVGHATEQTFTGLALSTGVQYYVTVKVQNSTGYLQAYGTSVCSSRGFTVDISRDLLDTASSTYFNNSQARVMAAIGPLSVTCPNFTNPGAGAWRYRIPVTVTERGIESRVNAPCEITVKSNNLPASLAAARAQIRVADEWGNEVPCSVTSRTAGPPVTVVLVAIVNLRAGESRTYWVYYGSATATTPAYGGFDPSTNDTSQRFYSKLYSRKLLPPGVENDPVSAYTKLTAPANTDDGRVLVNLPWTFPFFGTNRTRLYFGTNSYITVNSFTTYNNTWNRFIGSANPNHGGMIAPIWCDTMSYRTAPQNAGMYILRKDAGLGSDREIFYSRDNRYNRLDDIYIHQAVLYRAGDIAIRYEYLSPGALIDDGLWSDNGVNNTIHNTCGISRRNNADYLWTTPLIAGIGMTPTSFFQYKNSPITATGTEENAGVGWSFAGHLDSHVFDSRSTTPNYLSFDFQVVAGGGRFTFYTRTGSTPSPDGSWTAWTAVATNVNVNGSVTVPAPHRRYIQYRCVFQKAAAANTPQLDQALFVCRGLSIESVVSSTPVSQGQASISVQVTLSNYHTANINLASMTLTFDLGSYTVDVANIPAVIPPGSSAVASFYVTIADDSPVGTATVQASATYTAAGPLTFVDTDADTPHKWRIQTKARLSINQIEAVPFTVNKGQTVSVKMYLDNLGETDFLFSGATMTFTLGSYTQSVLSPASGTPVSGLGSQPVTFQVTVSPTSQSGVSILNGTASGVNSLSLKVTDDASAAITDSWVVQNPAILVLESVTASSTLYRGQTNVPIFLDIWNGGEETLNWTLSDLLPYFTVGSYANLLPVSAFPITVVGGAFSQGEYKIDVTPDSATGTSAVDAKVTGEGFNASDSLVDEYAVPPTATWTIVAEKVKTYKDSGFLFLTGSYNRPTSGTVTAYAKSTDLAAFRDYVIRWLDPTLTEVASTSPPVLSDASGTAVHQMDLITSSPLGDWKVRVTNPLNTVTWCENTFTVVEPASAVVTLQVPQYVSVGQPFAATMMVSNPGGAGLRSAYPGNLATSGAGIATFTGGPLPLTQDISSSGAGTFTWNLTAQAAGGFQNTGTAYGNDANSDVFLWAASQTSGLCTILTPASLTIVAASESYTNVYRNQQGLKVLVQIRNTGQASAVIDAASLTFTLGSHTQVLASPAALPFIIGGGTSATFTFTVAVASDSPGGAVTIGGSCLGHDANYPAFILSATGGNGAWTIQTVQGLCADNSSYNPEQYTFTIGQTVYARFQSLPLNTAYRLRFYNAAPTGGTRVKTSPPLNSGAFGVCDDLWTLDPANPSTIVGNWRVSIDNGTAGVEGTIIGVQYFTVQRAGNLVANITLTPYQVFVGDTVTVNVVASNTIVSGATIYPATASPLIPRPGASGSLTLVSGPSPASASIAAGSSATFTWIYTAATDTGTGTYSMTSSLASTAYGIEVNSGVATTAPLVISNSINIYGRSMDIASSTIDFGTLAPGDSGGPLIGRVNNTGNYQLSAVKWIYSDLNGSGTPPISKAYLIFAPDPLNFIATFSYRLASFSLTVPDNQASGPYIATMSVFEDLDGNNARGPTEPYDLFSVQVVVPSIKKIRALTPGIDLGDVAPGATSVTLPEDFKNTGNLDLTSLKFLQTVGTATFITLNPANPGGLLVGGQSSANVSAVVPAGQTTGIYIATWTLFEDDSAPFGAYNAPEASSTFQVRIKVGFKTFTVTPAPVDAGLGTPTFLVPTVNFNVNNSGGLSLQNLRSIPAILNNGPNQIATDNFAISPPASVAAGLTATGQISLYVPSGCPVGLYSGPQILFEDDNLNVVMDPSEASATFSLQVQVVAYPGIQVIPTTVDVGDLSQGGGTSVNFLCRNSGNVDLSNLRWEKVNLLSGTDVFSLAGYSFGAEPFFAGAGSTFTAQITLNVPLGQPYGNYFGSMAWLYEDAGLPTTRQATEPCDPFFVTIRVGDTSINIVPAGVSTDGDPNTLATPGVFLVANAGSLVLSNPTATASALVGPGTIPESASYFLPSPFGYLVPSESRQMSWMVNVPPGTLAGVYTGNVWAWNDTNSNGSIDIGEASDSATLSLTVNPKRVISVLPALLDLGTTPENSVASGPITITNVGNAPLTALTGLSGDLKTITLDTIPAASITFGPLAGLGVGNSTPGTVTVTIGFPQIIGQYNGMQRVYDDYLAPPGSYTVTEESATFTLRVYVGKKVIVVTPVVDLGNRNPGATWANLPPFTVTNSGALSLIRLKWLKGDMTSGANTISSTSITFAPAAFPVIPGGGSYDPASCQVALGAFQAPGTYIGTHTLWDDDFINDGVIQSSEASCTFQTQIVVNSVASLTLLSKDIGLGTWAVGATTSPKDVGFRNTGNATLTTFIWSFFDLLNGSNAISQALFNASVPASVNPGEYATSTVTLGPLPAVPGGTYSQSGFVLAGSGGAADTCSFSVIVGVSAPAIGVGSVYQTLATQTFQDPGPNNRFILSGWVCPGSGAVEIGLFLAKEDMSSAGLTGVRISSTGAILPLGTPAEIGIVETVSALDPTFGPQTWYRIYAAYDYTFSPIVASSTWLVLKNDSPVTARYAVWLDGIQLEKAAFPNQTRPTSFGKGKKIVSPNRGLSLGGEKHYYEW